MWDSRMSWIPAVVCVKATARPEISNKEVTMDTLNQVLKDIMRVVHAEYGMNEDFDPYVYCDMLMMAGNAVAMAFPNNLWHCSKVRIDVGSKLTKNPAYNDRTDKIGAWCHTDPATAMWYGEYLHLVRPTKDAKYVDHEDGRCYYEGDLEVIAVAKTGI